MKKLRLFLLSLLLCTGLWAQSPIVLSVADLLPGYGLDSAVVRDTISVKAYLDRQPQNYVSLSNLCIDMRTKVQLVVLSLEKDYTLRDGLLWIDTNIVVSDYLLYGPRLHDIEGFLGGMSVRYLQMEEERIEAEKEAARQRVAAEQRRQQEERNSQAVGLKQNIDRHHRAILSACDGNGITDKVKLKNLKDLYYSYLMVYNKYDLSSANATPQSLAQLDELNNFQLDILDNLLSTNSLPNRIDNFKNQLKARCEKDNSDVFRSYSRVFKNTKVPVSFVDLKEYHAYTERLRDIIAVQQRYMQALDLRAVINQNSDHIQRLYGKKYRDIANAYKETQRTVNLLPSFLTSAESISFVGDLQDFIEAQQVYIDTYTMLEELSSRSDTILGATQSSLRDIAAAYREVRPSLQPVPTFKRGKDSEHYIEQLNQAGEIQWLYMQTIAIRNEIRRLDDSITDRRRDDRILWNGYCSLRKDADLTPSFTTVEQGTRFIAGLELHRNMLRTTHRIQAQGRTITANTNRIGGKSNIHRNIAKAHQHLLKAIQTITSVSTLDDLNRYGKQCDSILVMQQAFLNLLASDLAADADNKLRGENDPDKIRIVLGLK